MNTTASKSAKNRRYYEMHASYVMLLDRTSDSHVIDHLHPRVVKPRVEVTTASFLEHHS